MAAAGVPSTWGEAAAVVSLTGGRRHRRGQPTRRMGGCVIMRDLKGQWIDVCFYRW